MRQVKTNYIALIVLALVTIFCGAMYLRSSVEQAIYDSTQPVARAELGSATLSVPTWNLFHAGKMWSLVSPEHHLESNFTPELAETTLDHAPGVTTIGKHIEGPLNSMFTAATSNNVNLMLSSAYRSATDQQELYDTLLGLRGSQYVQQYVAVPGTSEHQTGLAVDIASVSQGCKLDADACSLDATGITWLRTNAASYGFIERYPSGKQSITGVSGEHWHYRYVGVPLAKALSTANITLDEFVQQIAPGYAR